MAKIKYSALVSGVRNKLNGSVASVNRYGSYLRNKTSPINAQTSFQTAVRARFSANSSAWKSLTQEQRNAWNAAAPNFPFTDVFGDSQQLSGNSLYVKLNNNLQNVREPAIADPPRSIAIPVLKGFSVENTAGVYTIAWNNTVTGDYVLKIDAVANISPGKTFVKNLFKQVGTDATLTTGVVVTTMITDRFGALVDDQALWVRASLVSTVSGQAGLPVSSQVIIAGA